MNSSGSRGSGYNGSKRLDGWGSLVGGNRREEVEEKKALLPMPLKGAMARKNRKRSNRRVQWNDRHGKKLVQVLEYLPSDASDSDDEYLDSCICTIM